MKRMISYDWSKSQDHACQRAAEAPCMASWGRGSDNSIAGSSRLVMNVTSAYVLFCFGAQSVPMLNTRSCSENQPKQRCKVHSAMRS